MCPIQLQCSQSTSSTKSKIAKATRRQTNCVNKARRCPTTVYVRRLTRLTFLLTVQFRRCSAQDTSGSAQSVYVENGAILRRVGAVLFLSTAGVDVIRQSKHACLGRGIVSAASLRRPRLNYDEASAWAPARSRTTLVAIRRHVAVQPCAALLGRTAVGRLTFPHTLSAVRPRPLSTVSSVVAGCRNFISAHAVSCVVVVAMVTVKEANDCVWLLH